MKDSPTSKPQFYNEVVAERDRLRADEREWRRMLAFAYCGARLYGDDGELQDCRELPCIDFVRDPVSLINQKIYTRGMNALAKARDADETFGSADEVFRKHIPGYVHACPHCGGDVDAVKTNEERS